MFMKFNSVIIVILYAAIDAGEVARGMVERVDMREVDGEFGGCCGIRQ